MSEVRADRPAVYEVDGWFVWYVFSGSYWVITEWNPRVTKKPYAANKRFKTRAEAEAWANEMGPR